jgi:hypothetical protein
MKRATFSAVGVLIAIGVVSLRARRPRNGHGGARPPTIPSPTPSPTTRDDEPVDPLASLAAVERSASESAVAGMPSSIPAVPSIPSFATRHARESVDRSRS